MASDQSNALMLQGAKGGGGGSEEKDTLRSLQTAHILDLIGEGECGGLVAGLRSVYFDGVPVMNADGSLNFEDPKIMVNVGAPGGGTKGALALAGFDTVDAEIGVGVEVTKAAPIVRNVPGEADAVRVTLAVQQLLKQDGGDVKGSEFEYAIDVQSNGGGWVERHREKIVGKTVVATNFAAQVNLIGGSPYQVRVRRLTNDPDSTSNANAFSWQSYTVIRRLKLSYPHSAMVGTVLSGRQHQRIPTRIYDWLGLLVEVPSNYNPITRAYTGVWDGTFKLGWTDNPAWQYRDLALTKRYGAGNVLSEGMIDKWVLYEIAQYCDGLVPDGHGGMEPRFTCHLVLNTPVQAMQALRDLAAVFRAIVLWAGSQVHVMQDSPRDSALVYPAAKVVDGVFTYQSVSDTTRHSVFIVWFNDREQFGKRVPEVYAPDHLVKRYGVREVQLSPIGVWSRGQAQRIARWLAYTEEYEQELVAFSVGAEGALVLPGEVFQIADPSEAGERLGGLVRSATASAVTLDAPVEMLDGETYTLLIQFPTADGYRVESRTVPTFVGTTQVINVVPPFSEVPAPELPWILSSDQVEPTTWRCLQVTEGRGDDQYSVLAVSHDPRKFDAVELGVKLEPKHTSRLTVTPRPPYDVTIVESSTMVANVPSIRVTVGWKARQPGQTFIVTYRHESGSWVEMTPSAALSADILGLGPGLLEVKVRAVNSLGFESIPTPASAVLLGKQTPPADPTGGGYTVSTTGITLYWAQCPDMDYLDTELRMGDSYEDSVPLDTIADTRVSGTTYAWLRPAAGEYQIWVRHRNSSLKESVNPLLIPVTVGFEELLAWGQIQGRPKLFRCVSRGLNDTGTAMYAGIYNGETGELLVGGQRSYLFARVDRSTGELSFIGHYDVFDPDDNTWPRPGKGRGAAKLAEDMLATPVGTPVILVTNDEPARNRLSGGLPNAVYWCGGNRAVFEKLDFRYRSAYLLVGIAGIGEGAAWDSYSGAVDMDTKAWIDISFQLISGQIIIGGNKSSPNSLRDFHYVGDLNANSSLRLVARGNCSFSGSVARKVDGSPGGWDSDVYSPDGYVGGAFAGATPQTGDKNMMFGLNTDPLTDASFTSLDAAFYCQGNGALEIYESGNYRGSYGTYAPGDRLLVWYDGVKLRYSQNGNVLREVPWSTSAPLHFDSSFNNAGAVLADIHYGPMSSTAQAQAAADAAASAASTAQTNASNALAAINNISNDNVLSRLEKSRAIQDWNVLGNEQAGILAQADNYAVTSEMYTYTSAVDALGAYLRSLSPAWADLDQDTPINGAEWRGYWFNAYTAKQAVLDRIAANAKARLGALATINAVNTDEIVDAAVIESYDLYEESGVGFSNAT